MQVADASSRWVPSRFTVRAQSDDGLILYNSYTGAVGVIPAEQTDTVTSALRRQGIDGPLTGILDDLRTGGFLVPEGTNEFERAARLRQEDRNRTDHLNLIIMPSETCNFRCVYCYESFQRGTMLRSVQEGLKNYVTKRAPGLRSLEIQWFGGEPTTAPDVIEELSRHFISTSQRHDIEFSAGITTNGFNLTPAVADTLLLGCLIDRYQITIDGPAAYHNARRKLLGGGSSFDTIFENLRQMHQRPADQRFGIALRVNFDRNSVDQVPELIRMIGVEFEGDPRFMTYFRPIGQWGGPNDATLPVCYGTAGEVAMWELHGEAIKQGVPIALLHRNLEPGGSVCYAAQTYSFVIGADGAVYKCTVALDDERNRVGQLQRDGTLQLDSAKEALWIDGDESNDPNCTPCFFRPACQGARCPWIRIRHGRTPCPPTKNHIKTVLKLIAAAPAVDSPVVVDAD